MPEPDSGLGQSLEAEPAAASQSAPPPPPPPSAPGTPPPDAAMPQEPVEAAGQVVPLGALKDERTKRQALEAHVQELEAYVAQKQPLLTLLEQRPDLLRGPDPVPSVPPGPDPRAIAAAKMLDFYTADGQPDAARGAAHLAMVREEAEAIAHAAVQPLTQHTLEQQAAANFQLALNIRDQQGRPIDPQALSAVWRQVLQAPNGVAILADRQAAAFVASAAHGAMHLTGPSTQPLEPPLVTDSGAPSPPRRAVMSDLETRVAADRGRDSAGWHDLIKTHRPGRPNLVEE